MKLHFHSIYLKCWDCGSWSINFPDDKKCGCGSNDTTTYYPEECLDKKPVVVGLERLRDLIFYRRKAENRDIWKALVARIRKGYERDLWRSLTKDETQELNDNAIIPQPQNRRLRRQRCLMSDSSGANNSNTGVSSA